jgi:hypothetical protein
MVLRHTYDDGGRTMSDIEPTEDESTDDVEDTEGNVFLPPMEEGDGPGKVRE